MYIDTVDLRIKHVSEEFYEKFRLERDFAKIKIQKQDLFLNNIVMGYDPNTIMGELNNKKSLRCDFSTKVLVRKKKGINAITKFGGFINLYSVFGNDVLISINIMQSGLVSYREGCRSGLVEEKSGKESQIDDKQ